VHVLSQLAGMPRLTPLQLMNSNRTVSGVHIGRLWDQIAVLNAELREVLRLWENGAITPRIDATYPFEQAAEAHRRILGRQNTGKIVLTP
jgi:NADPH:quinone reductase-like Zn-dependent oxidoreductase